MKILIVGGGGREHALAWKCAQSPRMDHVFVAPGNAGTALEPNTSNVDIAADDITALLAFAEREDIPRKIAVLAEHCAAAGRDPASINKTWLASAIVGPTRVTWSVVAFALDPLAERHRFLEEHKTPEEIRAVAALIENDDTAKGQRGESRNGSGDCAPRVMSFAAMHNDANSEEERFDAEKNCSRCFRSRRSKEVCYPRELRNNRSNGRKQNEIVPPFKRADRRDSTIQNTDVTKQRDRIIAGRPQQRRGKKPADHAKPGNALRGAVTCQK